MDKRDVMLKLAQNRDPSAYVPAAFFLHFDDNHHKGKAAATKHLEYFRHTGMDFVKIQYEHPFPRLPEPVKPQDWARIPVYGADYFADPLEVVSEIVKSVKKEAMVIITLYSALMLAGQAATRELITAHLETDPESAVKGLKAINESLLVFVRECVKRGIDGFYTSTQGGEADRFSNISLFTRYIKPLDLALMGEINRTCAFNILHICDYHGPYADLKPFVDYPGHIVNCGTRLRGGVITPREVAAMFGRPFMGGMDRHGIVVKGSPDQIAAEVKSVIRQAPERFVLGADCTVPPDISWDNLRAAVDAAHGARR